MEYFDKYIRKTDEESEQPVNVKTLAESYSIFSPKSTWDFVVEHYGEVQLQERGYFFHNLSMNTFGRKPISEAEMKRRIEREDFLRSQTIPDLAKIVSEYEY
jgi:hypothetical protein